MKTVAFTIYDKANEKYALNFKKSLRHFHSEKELPLVEICGDELKERLTKDPQFFYRAKPIIALELFAKGYDTVIGMDCDQIITSDLNHILEDKDIYDTGTVLNDLPLHVWDVGFYFNAGLVVMKSKVFVEHWNYLCHTPHFQNYQYREQDLFNLLCSDYFTYKMKCYDMGERINGLIAKPNWANCFIEDNRIMVNTNQGKKQLSVIHFAGGNGDPSKGNYRIKFQPEVVSFIDKLLK